MTYFHRATHLVVIQLLLVLLLPATVLANSLEIAGPDSVITPTMTSGTALGAAWINPTGIQVGNNLYMYAQGGNMAGGPAGSGQTACSGVGGDQIHLFTAPHTLAGVTSPFTYQKRITPCEKMADGVTNWSWGPGQVFYDGQYRIIADKSNNVDFKRWSLGVSSNGVDWTWRDFAYTNLSGLEIYAPVLRYTGYACYTHCHNYWEGFFPMDAPGWGTGRMKVDVSPAYPRGFRIQILDGSNVWRTLNDSTGEITFYPKNVWASVGVRSMVYNNGQWELWGYNNPPNNGCHPCGTGPYTSGPAGTTFVYRTVDSSWNLGPVQALYSLVRCMPSDSHVGRLYPFRYNGISGVKLLFSTTNDANICRNNIANPFIGTYIVATEVDN